jgi:DNA-binding CsgD family transcriptional regulator
VARTDTLSVVEAAYASAPSDAEWLREVARAATSALGAELGAVAWFMDFLPGVDTKPRCEDFVRVGGCDDRVVTYLSSRHELTFPDPIADLVYTTAYGHGRSISGARELMGPLFDLANPNGTEETGAPDCLALQCFDAAGRGVILAMPSATPVRTSRARRATWEKIAAHVAAGLRLRRGTSAATALDSGDVVLDDRLRVCHAKDADAASYGDSLRRAAQRADRARLRDVRRDADGALDLWECLVSGEYSLIDTFDTDGKRLFVAKRNSPVARGPRALTSRERQVVCLLALGHADKRIAYELGVTEGAVARHVHAALRKLGVAKVTDLFALRQALRAERIGEPAA